jgi:hypothetical protein
VKAIKSLHTVHDFLSEGKGVKTRILELVGQMNRLLPDPADHLALFGEDNISKNTEFNLPKTLRSIKDDPNQRHFTVKVAPYSEGFSGFVTEGDYEEMRIYSFPGMHGIDSESQKSSRDEDGNMVVTATNNYSIATLEYGNPKSSVLNFDFKGDISIFTQLLNAVAVTKSLGSNSDMLNYSSIVKHVGFVLGRLISGGGFLADAEKETREELLAWSTTTSTGPVKLSKETIEWLASLNERLSENRIKEALKEISKNTKDGDLDSAEVFARFIKFLENESSWRALFNIDEEKSTIKTVYSEVYKDAKEDNESVGYILAKNNLFDSYIDVNTSNRMKTTYLMTRQFLMQYPAQIRVKILGVPEMDTILETSHRQIAFYVRDVSKERFSSQKVYHWLTGPYRVIGVKHIIEPGTGYTTDLHLIRDWFAPDPAGTSEEEEEEVAVG